MGSDHAGSREAHEGRTASGVGAWRETVGRHDALRFATGRVGFRGAEIMKEW